MMDTKDIMLGLSILLVTSMAGFYVATMGSGNENQQKEIFNQNFTVEGDQEIVTASFDERSLDMMLERSKDARFYLDLDQDGSFDIEIENQGDGTVENSTELVEIENRTYRLYLKTYDDSDQDEDAWFKLYKAVRQ